MADDMALAAMFEYYERGGERGRLDEPAGQLEFARTRQIIARHLPPPPATVADIGGGPGRYSLWLTALGYRVLHRDVAAKYSNRDRVRCRTRVRGGLAPRGRLRPAAHRSQVLSRDSGH